MGHRPREIKAKSGAGRVYTSLGGEALGFFDHTRSTCQEPPVRRFNAARRAFRENSASGVARISWSANRSVFIHAIVQASQGMSVVLSGHVRFEGQPRGNQ